MPAPLDHGAYGHSKIHPKIMPKSFPLFKVPPPGGDAWTHGISFCSPPAAPAAWNLSPPWLQGTNVGHDLGQVRNRFTGATYHISSGIDYISY